MGCTHSNSAKNTQADTEQVPSLKEQRKLDLQKKAFEQHEVFWVCHRDTLSTLKSLVKFEEAQKRNLLVQLRPGQKALFLSHRWLRDSHPDNKKKQKYDAIVFLLNDDCWLDAGVEFFWLDYMCISQDDLEKQTKAVNSLPFYIKGCQYFITLYGDEQIGDRSLMKVYDGRGWCRLERFVALATMSVQTYIFNMKTHVLEQTTIGFFQISNLNPICGVFRDGGLPGEQEKMRIAPMLSHLCNFASQYGGVDAIRELAKEIQHSIGDLGKMPALTENQVIVEMTEAEPSYIIKQNAVGTSFNGRPGNWQLLANRLTTPTIITEVKMGFKGLEGCIPVEIGALVNLTMLRLDINNLTGKIPQELGNLVNLARLDLDHNGLTGPIPDTFTNLTKLNTLDLSSNQLSGTLPAGLGNVEDLDISNNAGLSR